MRGPGVVVGLWVLVASVSSGLAAPAAMSPVTNWPAVMTDAKGFRWDVNNYGCVQQGSNYTYSNCMYLYIGGSYFQLRGGSRGTGTAAMSADRRMLVMGPRNMQGVNITRRVIVPEKAGYAIFVDLFENPSSAPVLLNNMYMQTNMNNGVHNMVTQKGGSALMPDDNAFVTDDSNTTSGNCAVVHVFAGKKARIRPAVQSQIRNQQIYYRYNGLTVPAKGSLAVAHIEAQRATMAEALTFLKEFKPRAAIRQIPKELRRLLINFRQGGMTAIGIDVPLGTDSDIIELASEDTVKGELQNKTFALKTFLGSFDFKKDDLAAVISMEMAAESHLIALKTGEVFRGDLAATEVQFALVSGSVLKIPTSRAWRIGLKMGEQEELKAPVPSVFLNTGEVLRVVPGEQKFELATLFGDLSLTQLQVKKLLPDDGGRFWQATLADGSTFGCFVRNRQLAFKHPTIGDITIPLPAFKGYVALTEEEAEKHQEQEEEQPRVVFRSGDVVGCRVTDKELHIITSFTTIPIPPEQSGITSFPSEEEPSEVKAELWGGGTVVGNLEQKFINFEGPTIGKFRAYVGHIEEIILPSPKLPKELEERIKALILKLGAEEFEDREAAQKELIAIGKPAIGMLKAAKESVEDAEIQARVEEILKELTE